MSKIMDKLDSSNVEEIKDRGSSTGKKDKSSFKSGRRSKFKKGNSVSRTRVNDPNWYAPNAELVRDVASIPYNVYNGVVYSIGSTNPRITSVTDGGYEFQAPGILVYRYTPWYGTQSPTSALNLTMRALYSFVRHVNSGRTNYEAPDLMLYIMSMDNIYLRIHEIKRLLKLTYLYLLENRDMPQQIFNVLGMDMEDTVQNIANYRARLNLAISKANSLAVPEIFNLFKRRAVFGSVILTDDLERPTQFIIPDAAGYLEYEAVLLKSGGSMQYEDKYINSYADNSGAKQEYAYFGMDKLTVNEMLRRLELELGKLLADEDINIMSGDIIKAYGNALYSLPYLQENEVIEISHDVDLLMQFKNATVLDMPFASFNYTKNTGWNRLGFVYNDPDNPAKNWDRPVISQKDGSLVAEVRLYGIGLQNDPEYSRAAETTTAVLQGLTNWPIEANAKEISAENTLEWTRLVMMSKGDIFGTLEAGTEIGLGWLCSAPQTMFESSTRPILHEAGVAVQWLQFGRPETYNESQRFALDTSMNGKYIRLAGFGSTAPKGNGSGYTRNENNIIIDNFVKGLSYGPRPFTTHNVGVDGTGNYRLFIQAGFGNFGAKTGLVTYDNIKAMHDIALLGLISSPYIKKN